MTHNMYHFTSKREATSAVVKTAIDWITGNINYGHTS